MADDTESGEAKKTSAANHSKIIASVAGAVLLGLQGVNLSEVIGTADLVKRTEEAIERQGVLIKEIDAESRRIEIGLENQKTIIANQTILIDRVNRSIDNQTEMLKHLQLPKTP